MADLADFIVTRVRDGQPDVKPTFPVQDLLPRGRAKSQTLVSLRDDMEIQSGSYVPTITHIGNIDASTSPMGRWLRVGNIVQVNGSVSIDPTLAAPTFSVIGISLPIASNFALTTQGSGVLAGLLVLAQVPS